MGQDQFPCFRQRSGFSDFYAYNDVEIVIAILKSCYLIIHRRQLMFGAPQQTSYDVRFVLFRIPVSITPFFWIIGAILAYDLAFDKRSNQLDPLTFVAAILAILISILVHELGHALVIRYIFGASTMIFLHGLGGVAVHNRPYYYRTPRRLGRIFISLAGPLAGFLLTALCVIVLWNTQEVIVSGSHLWHFLNIIIFICIFWGVINLLPVYPLDGGQIFREICLQVSQRYGMEVSAGVSAATAILLAILFFQCGEHFVVLLFGVLAWQSIQMLQTRRF